MSRRRTAWRVVFSEAAAADIAEVHEWWREQPKKEPSTFRAELRDVERRLRRFPKVGRPSEDGEHRRLLMRRCRHFVYYAVDERAQAVIVLRVWHTSRGLRPPSLTER